MVAQEYDVFISYRRRGGAELAQLVCKSLEKRGYHPFMDVRELQAGPFAESLVKMIEQVPDVVVLLTPGCLERCQQADDCFRQEVAHALRTRRNVIPFKTEDFQFPSPASLPDDISELLTLHCPTYYHEYADAALDNLCGRLRPPQARAGLPGRTGPSDISLDAQKVGFWHSHWQVSFTLASRHIVRCEVLGGLTVVTVRLTVDGSVALERSFHPPFVGEILHRFRIEEAGCLFKVLHRWWRLTGGVWVAEMPVLTLGG
jgi:hypothetical protein